MSDREAAIRERLGQYAHTADVEWLLAKLAAARRFGAAMERDFKKAGAELAAARERKAKLREALREARPYIYGVASDPANALWRRQTAQGVLERCDDALADGEGQT